jgi:hypothetical protein
MLVDIGEVTETIPAPSWRRKASVDIQERVVVDSSPSIELFISYLSDSQTVVLVPLGVLEMLRRGTINRHSYTRLQHKLNAKLMDLFATLN